MARPSPASEWTTPVIAGVVCALVGFTSSFAVVLAGLRAVGATSVQAASGLVALCLLQGVGMLVLAFRQRIPITLAWSTPGAALLVSVGAVDGGWPAAVGAFVVAGALIVATGFVPVISRLIRRIPARVASAMLAGVLLPLCLAPVSAVARHPLDVVPVLVTWLVLVRIAARWAVVGAFAVAVVVIVVELTSAGTFIDASTLAPSLTWTSPTWTPVAITGIAIPLWIVTMAAQNIPGVAVMRTFGFRVPWRESMTITGLFTALAAGFGGHALNLSAISAALAAGPQAHPDRERRWIAAVTVGGVYLVIGLGATAVAAVVALAPDGVVQTVAGLALLGTLASALAGALGAADDGSPASTHEFIPAVATFVVAAAGTSFFGVGPAFWAVCAGVATSVFLSPRRSFRWPIVRPAVRPPASDQGRRSQ